MNNILKVGLILLIIGYIISPVDLVPAPIDDIILAIAPVAVKIIQKKRQECIVE